jgi:hypothetical protein
MEHKNSQPTHENFGQNNFGHAILHSNDSTCTLQITSQSSVIFYLKPGLLTTNQSYTSKDNKGVEQCIIRLVRTCHKKCV